MKIINESQRGLCKTCSKAAFLIKTFWDGFSVESVKQIMIIQCSDAKVPDGHVCSDYALRITQEAKNA